MCRSIKRLSNLAPPATATEAREAALQYVRKIYGAAKPTKANAAAFDATVETIARATSELIDRIVPASLPATREELREKQMQRNRKDEAYRR